MNPAYVMKACHCTPLKMCNFCRKWLKPARKTVERQTKCCRNAEPATGQHL